MGPGSPMKELMYAGILLVSFIVSAQSVWTLYMTLYAWDRPPAEANAPDHFREPRLSFTALLPARHEEDVIRGTIARLARVNYPPDLVQVLVICSADDHGTIDEAEAEIELLREQGRDNFETVVFSDGPVNKPHGLNAALARATNDVIVIFDAEDDMHTDILNVVNTVMEEEHVKVVQAGVQLMNFESTWYSALNVLEYFFWFRSRMHYHSRTGAMLLGGNTVFFDRDLITRLGGWDEKILTEDAEIGLMLSAEGEHIRVVYDHRYVTKEEVPPTLKQFIKQRTRWNQGFIQCLHKGTWRQLKTRKQRRLAFMTLVFPMGQAVLGIYFAFAIFTMVSLKTPVLVALLSYIPVLIVLAHFLTTAIGLYDFTRAHGLKATPSAVVGLAIAWFPYQLVLAYASIRAVSRQVRGHLDWEKTAHVGAHRDAAADAPLGLDEVRENVA
jgi:cellulose synthase/poly-beta-1,6-N-acetylglucosamine synthase-like glycosyltransferase